MDKEKLIQEENITIIGVTNYRNELRRFGIKKKDRRSHMYIIGKTGMGKTTLLEHLIVQDIKRGEGVILLDPHGDLVNKILNFIPKWRINETCYFNVTDTEFPVAFNVMEIEKQEDKPFISSGLIAIFKKIWADSWGPRLEYVLRNTILALLDYPQSTLLGVMRMLTDSEYREKVKKFIKDPIVKSFWEDEFERYPEKFQTQVIAPIQNKVGQFLSTSLIRNIVGQVKSKINLKDVLENRKILLVNLSKGKIGEDSASLIGSMLITKLYMAALSRTELPEQERKDVYLYIDEFQSFATDSFIDILSEARKYRLNLILAHQYTKQLDERIMDAIFGNVGTIIAFRTGAKDAEILAKEFAPFFTPEDFVNLGRYNICLRLMIDGVTSNPFTAKTLAPLPLEGYKDTIVKVSRERYAVQKEVIESKIIKWSKVEIKKSETKEEKQEKIKIPKPKKIIQKIINNKKNKKHPKPVKPGEKITLKK